MKKRYLLFSGSRFYPFGGMEDFRGDFASEEEALADLQKSLKDSYDAPSWAHLWDSQEDVVTNLNDFIRMNQAKKG